MQFMFAADVIKYLHDAGLPRKHIEVFGSWVHGFSVPGFAVVLSETSDYEDVKRSLRLSGEAETAVQRWMDRRLNGTNARWAGEARPW